MNNKCAQCKFLFQESSIQANRRERLRLPILCQECFRIIMAESRLIKRNAKNEVPEKDSHETLLEKLKKIHGHLSPSLLMCKMKISYEEAHKLCMQESN